MDKVDIARSAKRLLCSPPRNSQFWLVAAVLKFNRWLKLVAIVVLFLVSSHSGVATFFLSPAVAQTATSVSTQSSYTNKVVATLGAKKLLYSDLGTFSLQKIEKQLATGGRGQQPTGMQRAQIVSDVQHYLDKQLLNLAARDAGLKLPDTAVAQAMRKFKNQFTTKAQWNSYLSTRPKGLLGIESELRERLTVLALTRRTIEISDETISRYYDEYKTRYSSLSKNAIAHRILESITKRRVAGIRSGLMASLYKKYDAHNLLATRLGKPADRLDGTTVFGKNHVSHGSPGKPTTGTGQTSRP
ncbi:hypothetical protein AB833_22420 [Chromatiales bacterium (ex Bugula neritina AB1)]|nr:hypothetical protein AB833_22420 [Chromatiales bacterium (ex Bugula neritina AB1)]